MRHPLAHFCLKLFNIGPVVPKGGKGRPRAMAMMHPLAQMPQPVWKPS